MTHVEGRLEQLERRSIKANMRIFNMPIEGERTIESLKANVIKQVCNIATPGEKWEPDDLKYIKTVGEIKDGRCPLTIATLRHEDDKYRIYQGRDNLRKDNIRVGDDFTMHQRTKLQTLKDSGKWGYYHRGKLIIVDKRDNHRTENPVNERTDQRLVKKAVRKLPPVHEEQETMDHQEVNTIAAGDHDASARVVTSVNQL